MRRPKHKRALREMERADEDQGEHNHRQRKARPPTDFDGIFVSSWRGQEWARNKCR